MDVQQAFFFGTNGIEVVAELKSVLEHRGYRDSGQPPLTRPSGSGANFTEKNRRFFFVSEFEPAVVSIVENGNLFEADLVKELSGLLECRGVWIALHESINAWGHQDFESGVSVLRRLFPEEAFSDSAQIDEVDYPGDATKEAFAYLESLDLPEAFVSYDQIAKGFKRPPSLKSTVHVSLLK